MNRLLTISSAMLTADDYRNIADKLELLQSAQEPEPLPGQLDSLEATAPPAVKAVGDLAQVSTGATGSEISLIGLMDWAVKWKRTAVPSTTTDGVGWETKLGSVASWSATAKFAYIDGDTSQEAIRAAITTLQTTSQKYNFFNQPATGRDSWSGNGILTGIDFATGSGKIFGMDLSIEGDGPLTLIAQIAPASGTAED